MLTEKNKMQVNFRNKSLKVRRLYNPVTGSLQVRTKRRQKCGTTVMETTNGQRKFCVEYSERQQNMIYNFSSLTLLANPMTKK